MAADADAFSFCGSTVRIIREAAVRRALNLSQAIDDVRAAMASQGRGGAVNLPRVRVSSREKGAAWLHSLRAGLPDSGVIGGKDYASLGFRLPASWATVVDRATGKPLAFLEADWLSRARTAATAAVATDLLAPADTPLLAHFGAGHISEPLIRAQLIVRPSIRRVLLVRRDAAAGPPPWAATIEAETGVSIELVEPAAAMAAADIAVTATSSRARLFPAAVVGAKLRHINLVGANHRKRSEIDPGFARRCLPPRGFLTVDDPDQAALEAGDFHALASAGELDWGRVPSLGALLADDALAAKARTASMTAFESLGMGLLDLAVAAGALRRLDFDGAA